MSQAANRLGRETSPYLQQHADNPVDWYPWGEEVFAAARERDVPVLLSIGYSACHWCHVMAHESFEDGPTAKVMNERFVNVKVDREERPDIDRIYQAAQHFLTQRPGGWPLTMFLDPRDQRPFFGGTYFPKESRYGMPAFTDLLERVADFYRDNHDDIERQGNELAGIFARLEPQQTVPTDALTAAPLAAARDKLGGQFDRDYGGFEGAPKFPHAAVLERLLRHWRATAHAEEPDVEALYLVSLTLKRMADGGIRDHVGGGFCRYSVDRYWQIPHFEKMLYDNGPLAAVYAQAALATGETEFRDVAAETAGFMIRRLQSPEGGFWSSLDADSEGEEGRYYVWKPEEVEAIVPADAWPVFARYYGLDRAANFEEHWHLAVQADRRELAKEFALEVDELERLLSAGRQALFEARRQRVPPGLDDKQLTSWNALAIRGLALAGRCLDDGALTAAAQRAADSLRERDVVDGRLYASYKAGEARFPAYLDDHAFLLDALLELLQNDWRSKYLDLAIELADALLEHFEDRENGGFWFTADDHEQLMHRSKPLADEALPSGAGIAAFALQRLGFLLGEARYLEAAERTLRNAWEPLSKFPQGHVSLLTALEEYFEHPEIIIVRGEPAEIDRWRHEATRLYAPARLVFAIPADAENLPGALADRAAKPGGTVAYRCKGNTCSLPLESLEALAKELAESNQA